MVWAQEPQVLRSVVAPVPVNVVNLQRNAARDQVVFGPAANHASAITLDQEMPNVVGDGRPASDPRDGAIQPRLEVALPGVSLLAGIAAVAASNAAMAPRTANSHRETSFAL